VVFLNNKEITTNAVHQIGSLHVENGGCDNSESQGRGLPLLPETRLLLTCDNLLIGMDIVVCG
jgi:hypothetical protein